LTVCSRASRPMAVHGRLRRVARGGVRERAHGPRIAVDRTIAQTERLLAIRADESPIVLSAQLADGMRTAVRGSPRPSRRTSDRPWPATSTRSAATTWPQPASTRALVRPERGCALPLRHSLVDDAGAGPGRGPPGRPGRARRDRRGAPRHRERGGFGGDIDAYRRNLQADPRTSPRPATRSSRGRARTSSERSQRRRAGSVVFPSRPAPSGPSTRSWRRTRRSPTTTRRRSTDRGPGSST